MLREGGPLRAIRSLRRHRTGCPCLFGHLFAEAGEEHEVLARTDAIIFALPHKGAPIVE